uniref:Uncharacterized protein n=1 Tax=Anguilla anguilla TaxID=7936 RepID=A0A0E9TE26_ANGAN
MSGCIGELPSSPRNVAK